MREDSKDERIDFSAIDPSRDRARWERTIDALAARAAAAAGPPRSVAVQLAAWWRPALALAAGVALVVWAAAPGAGPPSPAAVSPSGREAPAFALQRWALDEGSDSVWEDLEMLGVGHERL